MPAVLLFGFFEARNGIQQARDDAREMNREAALLIVHDIQAGSSVEYCTYTGVTLANDIWIKSTEGFETRTGPYTVFSNTRS